MGSQTQKTRIQLQPDVEYHGGQALGSALQWLRGSNPDLRAWSEGPSPSQYVGISPERERALGLLTEAAGVPGQVPGETLGEYGRTVRGDYLRPESNPYLSATIERAQEDVLPGVMGRYARAGRFGSGSMSNAVADVMGDIASRMWSENYQRERGRMLQAQSLAPQMQALEYADPRTRADMLARVGRARELDQRAEAEQAYRHWIEPMENIQRYSQIVSGSPMQAGVTQVDQRPFDWGSLLGSAIYATPGIIGAYNQAQTPPQQAAPTVASGPPAPSGPMQSIWSSSGGLYDPLYGA